MLYIFAIRVNVSSLEGPLLLCSIVNIATWDQSIMRRSYQPAHKTVSGYHCGVGVLSFQYMCLFDLTYHKVTVCMFAGVSFTDLYTT